MPEVFLSPFLSENEKFHATNLIKEICPDVSVSPKLTPSVLFRIATPKDIFYTTKMDCLTMTVLCLKQMIEKNITLNDLQLDWKIYCNLFLYQKKVVFYKLEEKLLKRYSTMVKCMGGTVLNDINSSEFDYIITKEYDKIVSPSGILPSWIETLFYESQYVKPVHFYVKRRIQRKDNSLPLPKPNFIHDNHEHLKQNSFKIKRKIKVSELKSRKNNLKSPVNEMRSIRSDNAGFILRRRDNSQDIRSFMNNPLSQSPTKETSIFSTSDVSHNPINPIIDENTSDDQTEEKAEITSNISKDHTSISIIQNDPIVKSPTMQRNSPKIFLESDIDVDDNNSEEEDNDDVLIISKEYFNNDIKTNDTEKIIDEEITKDDKLKNHRIPLKEKTDSNMLSNETSSLSKSPMNLQMKKRQTKKPEKKIEQEQNDSSSNEKSKLYNAIQNINSFNQSFENSSPKDTSSKIDYRYDSSLNSFSQSTQNVQTKNSFIGYDQSEDFLITEKFSGNDPFLSVLSGF